MSQKTKSIVAIVSGFFSIVALSMGTDLLMHSAGIFPRLGGSMSNRLFLLATAYRIVISVFGCYVAVRLAPNRPMKHALWLGVIGVLFAAMGVAASWSHPELGPHWYPVALLVVAIPCAWLGGVVAQKRIGTAQ
jgi:hypothetical protein